MEAGHSVRRPSVGAGCAARGPVAGLVETLQAHSADRAVLDLGDHYADRPEAHSDVGFGQLAQGLEDQAIERTRPVQRKAGVELAVEIAQRDTALDLDLAALVPVQAG